MSRILKQRKVIIGAIAGIAILGFILPTQQAHAVSLFGVESFTSRAILGMLYYTLDAIFGVIGYAVGVMAKLINVAVKVRAGGEIPVVKATWEILRDFSNMLFIIILIYMAFATIFNLSNYTFQKMIVRFIIVAVLINFSMSIGNLIIDATQVLSNVFLSSIGDLGNRLGEYMDPNKLLASTLNSGDVTIASLASLVFAVVLGGIFFFSLLVAAVFSIVRVPIIWGLLIVSPLAWMAYILPGTQKAYWNSWWNQFFGWNLFLPVYLFFMYLGLFFLSQRDQIIEAVVVTNANGVNPANSPLLGGLESSLTFNLIFFYLFTAFIMIGGTAAAVSTTKMMGGGFEKGLGWARATAGRVTGFDARRTAIQNATAAKRQEFQQQGFKTPWLNKIYAGKEGDKRIEARWKDRLRVGERDAVEKQLASEVSTAKGKIRNMNTTELQGRINSGSRSQRLAARELLKERNQLTGAEILNTYDMYGRDRTENGRKFVNSVDFAKLSGSERTALFNQSSDPQIRQKIAGTMAEKGNMGPTHADHVNWLATNARNLYAQGSERIDFIQKGEKEDFMATIEAKSELARRGEIEIRDGATLRTDVADILRLRVQKMKPDALAEVDRDAWGNADFYAAVQNKLQALQRAQPPERGRPGPPPVPPKPGGGDTFKANILKEVTDNRKLAIINTLTP